MVKIEVIRHRASVTQGEVEIIVNGQSVARFGDTIELIPEGKPFYGENIGGWASTTPDSDFIIGALYHPLDDIHHFSESIKKAIRG